MENKEMLKVKAFQAITKRTLTVKEMQTVLGIGRVTAYELCNSEGFPSFRIGKKILIDSERLNEWIRNGGEVKHEYINC